MRMGTKVGRGGGAAAAADGSTADGAEVVGLEIEAALADVVSMGDGAGKMRPLLITSSNSFELMPETTRAMATSSMVLALATSLSNSLSAATSSSCSLSPLRLELSREILLRVIPASRNFNFLRPAAKNTRFTRFT